MIFNIFKKKSESFEIKSSPFRENSASVYLDNQGSIIGTIYSNSHDEIKKNVSVNTILSKQVSIINESNTTIKEKREKEDVETTNADALSFLNWLNYPNSYPSPNKQQDITSYLIKEYFRTGLSGIVFTFNQDINVNNFQNIKNCQNIQLQKILNRVSYKVQLDEINNYNFIINPEYPNLFTCKLKNQVLVLCIMGDYDTVKMCYVSKFEEVSEYISLQNNLISFASSFHKNSCFPSQIVQLSYRDLDPTVPLTDLQRTQFRDAVDGVKLQIEQSKSAKNAGRIIVPNHPSLDIKVTPISIPTNAQENIAYQNLCSEKIYSFIDGGSLSAFEGKSEYANNSSSKLQELYDGTFRMYNSIFISTMTNFMRNLFIVMQVKVDAKQVYLSTDISKVKIYQKQAISETKDLAKENLLTISEARDRLSSISEDYASLDVIPQGNLLVSELNKSKVPEVVK